MSSSFTVDGKRSLADRSADRLESSDFTDRLRMYVNMDHLSAVRQRGIEWPAHLQPFAAFQAPSEKAAEYSQCHDE